MIIVEGVGGLGLKLELKLKLRWWPFEDRESVCSSISSQAYNFSLASIHPFTLSLSLCLRF